MEWTSHCQSWKTESALCWWSHCRRGAWPDFHTGIARNKKWKKIVIIDTWTSILISQSDVCLFQDRNKVFGCFTNCLKSSSTNIFVEVSAWDFWNANTYLRITKLHIIRICLKNSHRKRSPHTKSDYDVFVFKWKCFFHYHCFFQWSHKPQVGHASSSGACPPWS